MSDHASSHDDHAQDDHGHHDHDAHVKHYTKIFWILMGLFVVSYIGPEIANPIKETSPTLGQVLLLTTAFGIAFVKAWLVIKHFMHLPAEQPIIIWLMVTVLMFMVLFVAGTSPDVMRWDGTNWVKEHVVVVAEGHHGDHGDHGEHGAHGDAHGHDHATAGDHHGAAVGDHHDTEAASHAAEEGAESEGAPSGEEQSEGDSRDHSDGGSEEHAEGGSHGGQGDGEEHE